MTLTTFAPRSLAVLGTACLAGFIAMAGLVASGITDGFDRAVLLAMRSVSDPATPIGPGWLGVAMRDISVLGDTTALSLLTIAGVGYLLLVRRTNAALMLAFAVPTGALLSSLLKQTFGRARPDVVPHLTEILSASFPSGHAMNSTVAYLGFAALVAGSTRRAVRAYALALGATMALMIGISRVYLGVHWPSDVLAGWCMGTAWVAVCLMIANRADKRGTDKQGMTRG